MNARLLTLILLIVPAALPSIANASLADDSTAIISDSSSFSRYSPNFFGHIDFAVYAPGDYQGSLTFPSDQYVYCYQLFNDSSSTTDVVSLIVSLNSETTYSDADWDTSSLSAVPAGQVPKDWTFNYGTLTYYFGHFKISPGFHSVTLLYTSIYAPVIGTASIRDNQDYFTTDIPIAIPAPEPATISLFCLAAPIFFRMRKLSRQ